MSSKGFTSSLPFKLIVALVLGVIVGLWLNSIEGSALCTALLNIIVTVRHISGQFINFCVPLIIIGFVAPSITRLGSNASRMLILALILAYVSSIGAAFAATFAGYSIIPFLNIVSEVEGLKSLPEVLFKLNIPQIMPVISALFLSITVGLAAAWNRSKTTIALLEEFQKIVLSIVTKFLIPVLPFLIGTTFAGLAYEGSITKQFPVFLAIILIVMAGHYIWMALLYFIAGVYSGSNPFNVIKNYGPAYMTAVGTMSSAATRHGELRDTSFREHSPLRKRNDGNILRYGNLQDTLRSVPDGREHDSVLLIAGRICDWCTWSSWRYGYGLTWPDYRSAWV